MGLKEISFAEFAPQVIRSWGEDWFLLAAGSLELKDFNVMTVAWGMFGVMWHKPAAMAVVRPSRHTYRFMERYDNFTLCAFPPKYKDALMFCGTKSGRNVDKIKETGLTPFESWQVSSPAFKEAELVVEARKIYFDDFKPGNFLNETIESNYGGTDYHRIYLGEILAIHGTDKYRSK